MPYRRSRRYSRQLAAARAAKERKRLEGPAPEYPPALPELRRELIVRDHDCGTVEHRFELYRTGRVDQYRVVENGTEWAGRYGWARVLALVRQRFPRMRQRTPKLLRDCPYCEADALARRVEEYRGCVRRALHWIPTCDPDADALRAALREDERAP